MTTRPRPAAPSSTASLRAATARGVHQFQRDLHRSHRQLRQPGRVAYRRLAEASRNSNNSSTAEQRPLHEPAPRGIGAGVGARRIQSTPRPPAVAPSQPTALRPAALAAASRVHRQLDRPQRHLHQQRRHGHRRRRRLHGTSPTARPRAPAPSPTTAARSAAPTAASRDSTTPRPPAPAPSPTTPARSTADRRLHESSTTARPPAMAPSPTTAGPSSAHSEATRNSTTARPRAVAPSRTTSLQPATHTAATRNSITTRPPGFGIFTNAGSTVYGAYGKLHAIQ